MISQETRPAHQKANEKGRKKTCFFGTEFKSNTRNKIKNLWQKFALSNFCSLFYFTFSLNRLLTSSCSWTQKTVSCLVPSLTTIIYFPLDMLKASKFMCALHNSTSSIYQFLKLSQQCRCYHIIVKDFW